MIHAPGCPVADLDVVHDGACTEQQGYIEPKPAPGVYVETDDDGWSLTPLADHIAQNRISVRLNDALRACCNTAQDAHHRADCEEENTRRWQALEDANMGPVAGGQPINTREWVKISHEGEDVIDPPAPMVPAEEVCCGYYPHEGDCSTYHAGVVLLQERLAMTPVRGDQPRPIEQDANVGHPGEDVLLPPLPEGWADLGCTTDPPKVGGMLLEFMDDMGIKITPGEAEPDLVNHPPHYADGPIHSKCGETIECIDVVRDRPFTRGNAMKYLWRAGAKTDTIQDLEKAIWYIQDEINDLKAKEANS